MKKIMGTNSKKLVHERPETPTAAGPYPVPGTQVYAPLAQVADVGMSTSFQSTSEVLLMEAQESNRPTVYKNPSL